MTEPYNPLAMENLGDSVLNAMLSSPAKPLGGVGKFAGAGIYAIYYAGTHPAYERLSTENRDSNFVQPIYVGKAVPAGGRKGVKVATNADTHALSARLREHAKSIDQASNLEIEHFWARWLVIEPIWIPLGESLLISRSSPLWNALVDGFGNHDPGSGRISGIRSRWDTLHPGRSWAGKYPERPEDDGRIHQDISEHLRARLQ